MVGGDKVTEREQIVVIIQEALPVFSRINEGETSGSVLRHCNNSANSTLDLPDLS